MNLMNSLYYRLIFFLLQSVTLHMRYQMAIADMSTIPQWITYQVSGIFLVKIAFYGFDLKKMPFLLLVYECKQPIQDKCAFSFFNFKLLIKLIENVQIEFKPRSFSFRNSTRTFARKHKSHIVVRNKSTTERYNEIHIYGFYVFYVI